MDAGGIAGLRAVLEQSAGYTIFSRGKRYARSEWVGMISATHKGNLLTLKADVLGSHTYRTSLTFDSSRGRVSDFECTCPYDYGMCKHVVALGLAFCAQEEKSMHRVAPVITAQPLVADDAVAAMRRKLESAGIAAGLFSEELIAQMVEAERKAMQEQQKPAVTSWKRADKVWTHIPVPAPQKPKKPIPQKPFHERYDLTLSSDYRGCVHGVEFQKHGRMYWYQEKETAHRLLHAESDLTDAQKTLLALVEQHEKDYERHSETNPTDYTVIVAAARDVGMHMTFGETYRTPQMLAWREAPKIEARIAIEWRKSYDYNWHPDIYEYDCIALALPRFATDRATAVAAGEQGMIVISQGGIEMHSMSHALARFAVRAILAMREDPYMPSYAREKKKREPCADLADDEYVQINEIIADARERLALATDITELFEIALHEAKPVIVIDFQMDKHLLDILPSVDYGGITLPVANTIYRSLGKDKKLMRRADPAFGTTHVVHIEGTRVHIAPINRALEEKLFVIGEKDGEALGLSRKCRLLAKGEHQVIRYLLDCLSALKAYADERSYELRYPHDIPNIATADFRAEFDADMKAENDWFAFDLALYCGQERVTLSDIETFSRSGETLFKTKDGRLLKITNPETIARLLEMLEHFRREGDRFEGRAYHAPGLDAMAKSSPHYRARHSKGLQSFLKEAETGKAVKPARISAPFVKTLREYQKDGVHWIGFLRRYRFGGILADDMGLGKTLQAIAAITTHRGANDAPSLIVAPKTLLHNWKHEVETFAPQLKTLVVDGSEAERRALLKQIPKHDLVITSYPALQRDIEHYEKLKKPFHYCVLDEAQYIKNPRTVSAHTVKRLHSEYRLALTGTPLENSVEELWSIFDFLMPGLLGHHAHFQKHFGLPIMKRSDAYALEHLRAKTSVFMLRRTKEKVLKELPPKIEQTIECSLSDEQNILYQDVLARVKSDIFGAVKKKGFASSQIHVFAGLTRLRQICNHPALVLPAKKGKAYPSAKLDALLNIVEEIRAEKRKVLVFSSFTQMLDLIVKEFDARKINYEYLSGKTKDRMGVVEAFNTGDATAFLISTKAGGVGLNLTAADAVVIFDPWWNPQVERQATDRAHRIGQKKTVHVFRLRTKGTIEEKIAALQERKTKLFDAIVGESKDLFKKLTWDDVRELLQ